MLGVTFKYEYFQCYLQGQQLLDNIPGVFDNILSVSLTTAGVVSVRAIFLRLIIRTKR